VADPGADWNGTPGREDPFEPRAAKPQWSGASEGLLRGSYSAQYGPALTWLLVIGIASHVTRVSPEAAPMLRVVLPSSGMRWLRIP